MRAVVTGYTGILGRYLAMTVPADVELHGIARRLASVPNVTSHPTDLLSASDVRNTLDGIRPDLIINAAAEGSVDAIEGHSDAYRPLNVYAAEMLAFYAASHGISMIQISSNAVFGESSAPLREDSQRIPLNDYGRLKVEAEDAVLNANPASLVVRPILMYGWPPPFQRNNPATHWVGEARAGRISRVVTDVYTQPLAAIDCARTVWESAQLKVNGMLNVSGGVTMSLFEFARATMDEFGLPHEYVQAAASADFPGIAPRPRRVEFDLSRLHDELDLHPMKPRDGLAWLRATE